jgi:hypothetical protein
MIKMKRTFLFICLALLVLKGFAHPVENSLELVRVIGDDQKDDYIIFGLADAILTDKKDIFILNAKSNYISQYNWQGEFKRRIGRKGKGPQDFYFPQSLAYFKNKIYVLDRGNHRIAEILLDADTFNYYKQNENARFSRRFSVLSDKMFIGVFSNIREDRGRIGVVDNEGNIVRAFFKKYPVEITLPSQKNTEKRSMEKIARMVISSSLFTPVYHFEPEKDELIVSFAFPGNPIDFFVYNSGGKQLKKFSHTLEDKKYKFPVFSLEYPIDKLRDPNKWPERYVPELDSVFIYKDYYIAFLNLCHYVKKDLVDERRMFLVFDRKGNLVKKIEIEANLRIFRLSEGYFLSTIQDAEVEQLYIYSLNL